MNKLKYYISGEVLSKEFSYISLYLTILQRQNQHSCVKKYTFIEMFVNKRTLAISQSKKPAKKMYLEDSLSSLFLGQEESYHCLFHNQYHQIDKTTPFASHYNQISYNHQFVQMPLFQPSSLFLTPTSPKNTQYDMLIQSAKSNATQGISQKFNFEKDKQIQEYKFLQKQQQVQEKKTAPKSYRKNTTSLKNLSQSVYLIMNTMRKATYKQVGQRLIADMINHGSLLNKDKDVQTLKRRVYDALNVLVATGMLQKKGKEVYCIYVLPQVQSKHDYKNQKQIEEKRKIEENLHKKSEELEQKRNILRRLKEKKQNISRIIYRNQSQQPEQKKILNFPLISTIIEHQKIQLVESFDNQILFRFGYRPHLYGDVDLMLRITEKPAVKHQTQVENIHINLSKVDDIQSKMDNGKTQCLAQMDQRVNLQAQFHQ